MKRFSVVVMFVLGIAVVSELARADSISLYKPTSYSGSSSSSGYTVDGLFDGSVTAADIGTSNNVEGQYACDGNSGDMSPTVAMDFGSSHTFSTMVYCQRLSFWYEAGQHLYTDWVDSIDLWFGDSAFTASYPATIPNRVADETLIISQADGLFQYDFTSSHTGQYVLARLNSSDAAGTANPGGRELLLGSAIPEPSSLMLISIGMFSLLAYAWRKRK